MLVRLNFINKFIYVLISSPKQAEGPETFLEVAAREMYGAVLHTVLTQHLCGPHQK